MHRLLYASLLVFHSLGCFGQIPASIQTLYDQLNQPTTTNAAAREIRDLTSKDSTARQFVAQRIPSLISGRANADTVWMNAVRLAGQLKVTSAIPALKQALSRGEIRGGYDYEGAAISLAEFAQLRYDIVGRALADIGDPSVSAVADFLSGGDVPARKRAVFILSNINSPAAMQAMRDHFPTESEPAIRNMIQQDLHLPE